jgi:hypothetical protein
MIESRANNCQALPDRAGEKMPARMLANRRQGCLRSHERFHADTFDNASNRRITSMKIYDGQTRLSLRPWIDRQVLYSLFD